MTNISANFSPLAPAWCAQRTKEPDAPKQKDKAVLPSIDDREQRALDAAGLAFETGTHLMEASSKGEVAKPDRTITTRMCDEIAFYRTRKFEVNIRLWLDTEHFVWSDDLGKFNCTGLSPTHPDFAIRFSNSLSGWNFVGNNNDVTDQ
jgi:hypothetical protein